MTSSRNTCPACPTPTRALSACFSIRTPACTISPTRASTTGRPPALSLPKNLSPSSRPTSPTSPPAKSGSTATPITRFSRMSSLASPESPTPTSSPAISSHRSACLPPAAASPRRQILPRPTRAAPETSVPLNPASASTSSTEPAALSLPPKTSPAGMQL
jgi:hypothetical protein